ncbi:MAG: DUF89 family protein [Armatimonadota bacterium]|nr:MAG: DUF89 family protein [Armatimonadota bacterium]
MKTYLECLPCFLRQAVEAAKMASEDPLKQWEVVDAVLRLLTAVSASDRPPQVAARVHRTVRRVSGCDDPYCQVKKDGNKAAMGLYPRAKELVAASDDSLQTAVKLAIVGNIIDSGVGLHFDLEAEIERANERGFATDDFDRLREEMATASTVLCLADNAGEIVFDRLLIEQMNHKKVFFAVRAEPMLNDALLADAEFAGIDRLADLVTAGPGWPGAGVGNCSSSFLDAFTRANVIIAKGQGNYEWLSEAKANIFFLLMAKCPVVARDLGVEVGELVVKSAREN